MADPKGFLKYTRHTAGYREREHRLRDYHDVVAETSEELLHEQAARCMDCGVPFCHSGCPLGNVIPEFNDAVYRKEFGEAYQILRTTNNFPEFTGRICPAPCEAACVLGINQDPVTIELIEKAVSDHAYASSLVIARPPALRSGKRVAVVGSGPAGLTVADELNQKGHLVTVFEREDRIGGLLRYGIPDFKLEKELVDRRLDIMRAEGIEFKTGQFIGKNVSVESLEKEFDAVVLCIGSTKPRDLPIAGRDSNGVHFAMDFLRPNNKKVAGDTVENFISAEGKHVIVIGGGDTGSDCVGTSNRHGAASITQLELMPKPPEGKNEETPWPNWPLILRTSSSHEEGAERKWSVLTKEFVVKDGQVTGLVLEDVSWVKDEDGRQKFVAKPDSERTLACDLALLAIGFVHPEPDNAIAQLGLEVDTRGNIQAQNYQTSRHNVFTAGDARRGQSLVVWAIAEGRAAAQAVDEYLVELPAVNAA
ncbi:MAG: glutamate synthase subunit beta [Granulosicoccus sp.]|nr:glutamate synthase subunit beta [Granulosicoccus sp.]